MNERKEKEMKHQIQIVKHGESPKVRRGRVPMHIRARQVLTAIETVHVKGVIEFDASNLAVEVGCTTAAALYVLNELQHYEVVELLTPAKQRYRKWRVTSWDKVIAFRQALESGQISFDDVKATEKPPLLERIIAAVTGHRNQAKRLSEVEDRLTAIEGQLTKLINGLGGL